jgi:hypothetical protein
MGFRLDSQKAPRSRRPWRFADGDGTNQLELEPVLRHPLRPEDHGADVGASGSGHGGQLDHPRKAGKKAFEVSDT